MSPTACIIIAIFLGISERALYAAECQPHVGDVARSFNRDLRMMLRGADVACVVMALILAWGAR